MDTQKEFISKENIEQRLYKLIGCNKSYSQETDLIVDLVSSFYENYQKNMKNLFDEKFYFENIKSNSIHFNNVFMVSQRELKEIYHFHSSAGEFVPNKPDTYLIGFSAKPSFIHTDTKICPETLNINLISSENKNISDIKMIIHDYLYLNLYAMEEFYKNKIQEIKKVISPIAKILFLLEKNQIDISDFLKSETLYSKKEIYDTFEANKDIIMLSTDQSIDQELFILKNYIQKDIKKTLN